MANTYTLIASNTLTSPQSSIGFTSIPSTYTDLVLKLSLRFTSTTNDLIMITLNGSTASFNNIWLYGNGSSVNNGANSGVANLVGWANPSAFTANTFNNMEMVFANYATSANKSYLSDFVSENNSTNAVAGFIAGLWSNSAAINSISLADYGGGNLATYSTAYLYGVKNA
jgi:hypothetical protein